MKHKGTAAERELLKMFWGSNLACIRIAGSGSLPLPCPDLLASNGTKTFAIECKAGNTLPRYITNEQISELLTFSKMFGAIPLVAYKVPYKGWRFFHPDDLEKTDKNHIINHGVLEKKSKFFLDLIKP